MIDATLKVKESNRIGIDKRSLIAEKKAASSVTCAITTSTDGSEDGLIHCFKKDGPIPEGAKQLADARIERAISGINNHLSSIELEEDIGYGCELFAHDSEKCNYACRSIFNCNWGKCVGWLEHKCACFNGDNSRY
ncbi:unnamed protein product, partial [Mesorhabditis belari]|uniref:Invertebrate defensins family profile domain-containing protein n=1 Tax=Mesorhabditis belari TaxID=2138241 RepID=A0AAF3EKC5_9BILA